MRRLVHPVVACAGQWPVELSVGERDIHLDLLARLWRDCGGDAGTRVPSAALTAATYLCLSNAGGSLESGIQCNLLSGGFVLDERAHSSLQRMLLQLIRAVGDYKERKLKLEQISTAYHIEKQTSPVRFECQMLSPEPLLNKTSN